MKGGLLFGYSQSNPGTPVSPAIASSPSAQCHQSRCFRPIAMGPVNLLFLVVAAAAPLLSATKPSNNSMAKPPMLWINNDDKINSLVMRPILIQDYDSSNGLNFAAGFLCASNPTCDLYLFAVLITNIANDGGIIGPILVTQMICHVWSSGNSGRHVDGMVITEMGNLVLFDHRNAAVWQSFDHPTDTLVPGQSLLEGMRLKANASPINSTENELYITVLQDGLYAYAESTPRPQLYFLHQMQIQRIGNALTKATLMNGSLSFIWGPDMNEKIRFPVAQYTQYMRLDSDGYLRLYEWSWSIQSWIMVYDILGSMGMDTCDYPTVCGEYGICTGGQCTCPLENNSSSSYFKPVDDRKPNLGCTPLAPLTCQEIQHHQLLTIPNISYYDNFTIFDTQNSKRTSIGDCKQACLKNCSCMAVLFRGGECVSVTKVFSMQSIQPETNGYDYSAYLKVQLSPADENKKKPSNENKKKVMLGATLGSVTTLLLLFIVVALYLQRRRKYEDKDEFDFDQLPGTPTRYSFEKLSECTEEFSKKLGEGGFGSVFEGKIGEERIAVKRLEGARQGKKEFLAEVETIGSIEHINLVRLIGFCAEKSERLLVYEYMPEGRLIGGSITAITMSPLIGAPDVGSFWISPRAYAIFMRTVGGKLPIWISNHKIFSWMTTSMPKWLILDYVS
uniref:Uncharacterized protein n=1 Tax=Avena sativa TaxID=4498 RepID=A0ACD5ZEQ8_AVESA